MDNAKTEGRASCPYCGEKILKSAKKCRYCGEWISKSLKEKQKVPWYKTPIKMEHTLLAWVMSIILFYLILYLASGDFSESSDFLLVIFLVDIFLGFVAFLLFASGLISGLFQKKYRKKSMIYSGVATGIFILFFVGLYQFGNQNLSVQTAQVTPVVHKSPGDLDCPEGQITCHAGTDRKCTTREVCVAEIESNREDSAPTSILKKSANINKSGTNSSDVTCIGPDGKQFETSMDECKNLNEKWGKQVDYMTNCNIQPECGGGTIYMSKSKCDQPCSGVKPTNGTTTTSTISNTYICKITATGNVIQTKDQLECMKLQTTEMKWSLCQSTADSNKQNCLNVCNQKNSEDNDVCSIGYTGPNALVTNDPTLYGQCLDESRVEWEACTKPCYDKAASEYKECISK